MKLSCQRLEWSGTDLKANWLLQQYYFRFNAIFEGFFPTVLEDCWSRFKAQYGVCVLRRRCPKSCIVDADSVLGPCALEADFRKSEIKKRCNCFSGVHEGQAQGGQLDPPPAQLSPQLARRSPEGRRVKGEGCWGGGHVNKTPYVISKVWIAKFLNFEVSFQPTLFPNVSNQFMTSETMFFLDWPFFPTPFSKISIFAALCGFWWKIILCILCHAPKKSNIWKQKNNIPPQIVLITW